MRPVGRAGVVAESTVGIYRGDYGITEILNGLPLIFVNRFSNRMWKRGIGRDTSNLGCGWKSARKSSVAWPNGVLMLHTEMSV